MEEKKYEFMNQIFTLFICLFIKLILFFNKSWTPPSKIRKMSKEKIDEIRKNWHIIVEGDDVPPPIKSFKVMKNNYFEFTIKINNK